MNTETETRPLTGEAMTPAETRVAIARDVIAQLQAGTSRAESSTYCYIEALDEVMKDALAASKTELDLRTVLTETPGMTCDVCAKGALFVAHVRRFDGVKLPVEFYIDNEAEYAFDTNEDVTFPLEEYFDVAQLRLIEHAFEGWDVRTTIPDYDHEHALAVAVLAFRDNWPRGTERLTAIMANVIRNKGTFDPFDSFDSAKPAKTKETP